MRPCFSAPAVRRVSHGAWPAHHQETLPAPGVRNGSAERLQSMLANLHTPEMRLTELVARFLEPPLYSLRAGFTTAYTVSVFIIIWTCGLIFHHKLDSCHFILDGMARPQAR